MSTSSQSIRLCKILNLVQRRAASDAVAKVIKITQTVYRYIPTREGLAINAPVGIIYKLENHLTDPSRAIYPISFSLHPLFLVFDVVSI